MADKKFIGRTKAGKYPDQIEIGLQQKDIDLLQQNLKNGWVNIRANKGRESGKYYSEIIVSGGQHTQQPTQQRQQPSYQTPSPTDFDDSLPF